MRSLKQLWEIHFHELKNIDDHKVSVDIRLMADLLAKQDIYVAGKKVNLMHYNPELVDPVMEKVDRLREYYYACLKDNDYSILISKDVTLEDIERERQEQ